MPKNLVTGALNTTSGTVTISGFSGTFAIEKVAAITNVKTGQLIYCPAAGLNYTSVAGSVVTIPFPMTGMSNADPLAVVYDDLKRYYTPTSRSGSTSATANTYTQVMAANSGRLKWQVQNTSSAGVMTIAFGASGSEADLVILQPGDLISESGTDLYNGRIAIKCDATSQPFLAMEAA